MRDPAHELRVGAERLVEDAVAELLERARGVPHLDPRRARAWRDHVHREEVVVDDEDARRREVVARPGGERDRAQAGRTAPLVVAEREDRHRDGGRRARELVAR